MVAYGRLALTSSVVGPTQKLPGFWLLRAISALASAASSRVHRPRLISVWPYTSTNRQRLQVCQKHRHPAAPDQIEALLWPGIGEQIVLAQLHLSRSLCSGAGSARLT